MKKPKKNTDESTRFDAEILRMIDLIDTSVPTRRRLISRTPTDRGVKYQIRPDDRKSYPPEFCKDHPLIVHSKLLGDHFFDIVGDDLPGRFWVINQRRITSYPGKSVLASLVYNEEDGDDAIEKNSMEDGDELSVPMDQSDDSAGGVAGHLAD